MEIKDSITLPKTGFSMKADLPKKEPGILDEWLKNDIYKKLREQSMKEGVDNVFSAALLGGIAGAAGGFALAAMMFEQFTKKEE